MKKIKTIIIPIIPNVDPPIINNNLYHLNEFINSNSVKGSDDIAVIYKGYGKNIQEALTDVATKISKNIYLNSIEVLIINEEIAKNGIFDILDLFFRKEEINKQFFVLILK